MNNVFIYKKRIIWVTMSCFYDVDIPLVHRLADFFDIEWIVFREYDSLNCSVKLIENYLKEHKIKGQCISFTQRQRSFNSLKKWFNCVSYIKEKNPDILYVNFSGFPYFLPILDLSGIDKKKIIWTCHDFIVHKDFQNGKLIALFRKYGLSRFNNIQLFSRTQQKLFIEKYPNKNNFCIPLFLKDFGKPTTCFEKHEKKVIFTFFGTIRNNKGLQVLLEAGNKLYETHAGQFLIRVFGNSKEWKVKYAPLIQHPKAFELNIRFIENEEIPNIFSTTHFLVLPYLDVTQSGPLLISYNYNVPVIASDHDGFKENIINNETGYLFENENPISLCNVMANAIESKQTYDTMLSNLKCFITENFSEYSIISKYQDMFNSI